MKAAVDLLAAKLPAGLTHPGDPAKGQPAQALPLPGLSNTGIPPDMAKAFADEAGLPGTDTARLLAEAIIHTLTEAGLTIVADDDLEALRAQAADAPDGTRVIAVHTACDRAKTRPILELTVTKTTDRAVIPCRALKAVQNIPADCPHR